MPRGRRLYIVIQRRAVKKNRQKKHSPPLANRNRLSKFLSFFADLVDLLALLGSSFPVPVLRFPFPRFTIEGRLTPVLYPQHNSNFFNLKLFKLPGIC